MMVVLAGASNVDECFNKKTILIDAGMHSREVITPQIARQYTQLITRNVHTKIVEIWVTVDMFV